MKWLINPFERIAGWQALLIGLVAMALTAVVGKINNVTFAGPLYVSVITTKVGFSAYFIAQAVNFLVLFFTMWLAGVLFSKTKPRVINIAGTLALSFSPMLLLTILCFLPITPASLYDIPHLIVFLIISVPFIIWIAVLMYNAYSVSCNLKGTRAILSFVGALAIAQIALQIIFFLLLSSLFTNIPIRNVSKSDSIETVVDIGSLTILQKTENVVKAFEGNNFDAITVYFDENMKKGLPSSSLRTLWIQLNMSLGKFERADIDNLRETPTDRGNFLDIPFLFERGTLNFRLSFNNDGIVNGLYFLNPES